MINIEEVLPNILPLFRRDSYRLQICLDIEEDDVEIRFFDNNDRYTNFFDCLKEDILKDVKKIRSFFTDKDLITVSNNLPIGGYRSIHTIFHYDEYYKFNDFNYEESISFLRACISSYVHSKVEYKEEIVSSIDETERPILVCIVNVENGVIKEHTFIVETAEDNSCEYCGGDDCSECNYCEEQSCQCSCDDDDEEDDYDSIDDDEDDDEDEEDDNDGEHE
jgi:hypothetical protein